MSSRFRLSYVALSTVMALSVVACVDPKKTFDEFGDRVLDAAPIPDATEGGGGVFDVTGPFLLSIATTMPVPVSPIRFLVNATFTPVGDGGTVDLTIQPLAVEACIPGEGGTPFGDTLEIADIPVESDGTFEVTVTGSMIPMEANPLSCELAIGADIALSGTILSTDAICGTVGGMVSDPIMGPLVGTFGAIRVADPAVSDANLPPPQTACPTGGSEADAGPGNVDAGAPDAAAETDAATGDVDAAI